MDDAILVSQENGILEIRINRPDKKNALTGAMYGAIADAIDSAHSNVDIRAILFSSEGDIFSAGNDLSDFANAASGGSSEGLENVVRVLHALAILEKPVIAAVGGDGVGVGATILLHCDIVVIADEAQLTMPFTSLGLTPEAGSSLLLPEIIGHKRAFMMLALGEPLSGRDAAELGLATLSTSPDSVYLKARSMAEKCCKRPPEAMRITKKLLRDKKAILERIDVEALYFKERLSSPEAREAIAAFFKR